MLKALCCLVLVGVTPLPSWAAEKVADSRVVLGGVDYYRVIEPVAEGVRVILAYRGEKYSPAYVQGISGAAFRIAGPCPCAPTCWGTMEPVELARIFGYEAEQIDIGASYNPNTSSAEASDRARRARLASALGSIKEEIRANRPALLVQAFTTWEWDVVCGFDDTTHELYGRGSYESMRVDAYTQANEMHALGATEIGGGPYAVLIKAKTGQFDARAAEVAALRGAVAHARTSGGDLPMGVECYDGWIARYRGPGSESTGQGLPPDWYPLSILPSTRQAAGQFMAELAAKCPRARANLESASEAFAEEAEALSAARQLRASIEEDGTAEQCTRMAGLLRRARAMYCLGIEEIADALAKLDDPQSELGT